MKNQVSKGLSDGQMGSLRAINMKKEVEIATFAVASNMVRMEESEVLMEKVL